MLSSLKSKFIVYFMGAEVFFLLLIITINFTSLDKVSGGLINEKITASGELFSKLISAPVLTLDLATLDEALRSFAKLEDVVAVKVLSLKDELLSLYKKDERLLGKYDEAFFGQKSVKLLEDDQAFRLQEVEVSYEGERLATAYILFDTSKITILVHSNKTNTYLIFSLALLFAFSVAYLIGQRLGSSLQKAAKIADEVAHEKPVDIVLDEKRHDEVSDLFEALLIMKQTIEKRTQRLNAALKGQEQFLFAMDEGSIVSKTDSKGIITYVNDRFCDISGYSREELVGVSHNITRHPDMPERFFKNLWETIKSKRVFKGTIKNLDKEGNTYYVDSTLVPILDVDDNIIEYIAIRYDVTSLIDAINRSQEAERAKSEFLSNMSHEIRTPMNAILGFVHILQERLEDDTNLSYMDTIEKSSKQLLHVINDILDFSKIESGKFSIEKEPFEVGESFKHVYELFVPQAEKKNIDFILDDRSKIDGKVVGDVIRIQQIVTNFLSNAFKFTSNGKKITLSVDYDVEKHLLKIAVADEGIGMNDEAKKRIFNAFEQADGSTTRLYGGTGLGLSISLKLVELMGGTIDVESSLGEGSTFTLEIPADIFVETGITQQEDKITQKYHFEGHVLVAEDNKTNQMLIKIFLDELDVSYVVAENGLEAVKAYKEGDFDIILMDENMPEMNGITAVENIRAYEKETAKDAVPIVAVTANVMNEDQKRFKEVGMDDFIPKPIDPKMLQRVFLKYLKIK